MADPAPPGRQLVNTCDGRPLASALSSSSLAGMEPSARRGSVQRHHKPKTLQACEIRFSLDEPPPVHIDASALLSRATRNMPISIRCTRKDFIADANCRDACVLTTHSFWYCFCALQQPESEGIQAHLMRLMAQHFARLSFALRCDKDVFFVHFPPLLAHAVLYGLRTHNSLPKASATFARSVFCHLVALLGGHMPPHLMQEHFNYAERPPTVPGEHVTMTSRMSSDDAPSSISPPLLMRQVPPLVSTSLRGRSTIFASKKTTDPIEKPRRRRAGGGVQSVLQEQAPHLRRQVSTSDVKESADAPEEHREGHSSFRELKFRPTAFKTVGGLPSSQSAPLISHSRNKPLRVRVDLNRQSPLIALFNGQAPEMLPSIIPAGASSHSLALSSLQSCLPVKAGAVHRRNPAVFSLPASAQEKRLYGGEVTFKPLSDPNVLKRSSKRLAEFETLRRQHNLETRLLKRVTEIRCREIDAARDYKLSLDPPTLADFTLDVVEGRKNVEADLIRFKAEGRQQRLDGKPASPSPPKDGGLRKSPKRSSHTP